ncbi:restriction endonuclease subunit S [Flavobacterium sp.]|uniref:restriction endonuclease subunit S n=2 Tax=Flavobacterium sp. TaxID=239 RepID=UPI004048150E
MESKLPKNWINVNLQDVTKNIKGKKPKIQSEVEFEGSVPYMDIKALEYSEIRQFADIESSKHFEEGDVAMVWDGARSGWVSKTNFGAIGSTLVAFKPIKINSNYLFYYLLEKYPFINSNARGVGIPHVDPTILWSLDFPLPPLAEQNRIVAKLDALFAQLETIKASMAKVPLLLKDFRQQVLTQAVTGKLTEEWRNGKELEDVNLYFERIKKDLEENYQFLVKKALENGTTKPRDQRKNKISDKGDPILNDIPNDWSYFRAEELFYLITDGVHFKPKYIEKGVKFLSVKNVRPFKINSDDCKFISDEDHLKYIQRCNPENGDILYTKVGATYGYAAKINENYDFSIFVSLALLKPSKLLNSSYLELLFNSPVIFNQANFKVSGIGVPDLHLIEIRDFKIPLPSFDEQQEIVSRVESLFAKADAIEKQYETLKAKIESLPQAILHKAFKGELTEQLDSDGDARELLEEIERLKAVMGKKGKSKTTKSVAKTV